MLHVALVGSVGTARIFPGRGRTRRRPRGTLPPTRGGRRFCDTRPFCRVPTSRIVCCARAGLKQWCANAPPPPPPLESPVPRTACFFHHGLCMSGAAAEGLTRERASRLDRTHPCRGAPLPGHPSLLGRDHGARLPPLRFCCFVFSRGLPPGRRDSGIQGFIPLGRCAAQPVILTACGGGLRLCSGWSRPCFFWCPHDP